MDRDLIELLKRMKYYLILNGVFLGIEIPLVNALFFQLLPRVTSAPGRWGWLTWIVSPVVGLLTSAGFYAVLRGVLFEDYQHRLLEKDRRPPAP